MKYSVKLNRKRTVSRNDAELSTKKEAERERQLNKLGKIVSEKRQIAKVEEKIGGRGDIPTQRKKKRLTIARFEKKCENTQRIPRKDSE